MPTARISPRKSSRVSEKQRETKGCDEKGWAFSELARLLHFLKMHFMGSSFHHPDDKHLVFRYQFFSMIFCCVGLVFLFTSLFSPFWTVIIGPTVSTNLGLWSICKKATCKALEVSSETLRMTRILMSFSTLSGLVAVVCTFLTHSSLKKSKWPLITNLVTGIMTLITVLLYGLATHSKHKLGKPIPPTTFPVYVSWSFIMGCFACFLFLMNGLLFVLIELQEIFDMHNGCKPLKKPEKTKPVLAT